MPLDNKLHSVSDDFGLNNGDNENSDFKKVGDKCAFQNDEYGSSKDIWGSTPLFENTNGLDCYGEEDFIRILMVTMMLALMMMIRSVLSYTFFRVGSFNHDYDDDYIIFGVGSLDHGYDDDDIWQGKLLVLKIGANHIHKMYTEK